MFNHIDPGERMVRTADSKIFQDAVHGPMEFHELLVAVIDTPEFQRMRNIKQLSLTYFVYPAAAHNRFEHSLGVCFLADQLLKAIEDNTEEDVKKKTFLKNGQDWEKLKLCVLIAGLCHDLGHGPFSHTWEVFVAKANYMKNEEDSFEHEAASGDILDMIARKDIHGKFKKHGIDGKYITIIKELIMGEGNSLDLPMKFLYEIVANKKNDIDVDKWDYFLRDGLSFDLKITFDYRRLLKFCKVKQLSDDGPTTLAFRDKEYNSLQDMFRMRADLHIRAYQHRVSKNIELMFIDAMLKADTELRLSEAHKNMDQYTKLTDHILQDVLYKTNPNPSLVAAQETLSRIMERHLYKQIMELDCDVKLKMKQIFDLETEMNKDKDHYGVALIHVSHGKHSRPLQGATFYPKDPEEREESAPKRFRAVDFGLPCGSLLLFCKMKDCPGGHQSAEDDFRTLVENISNRM